jgi:large subunit ribosomal protein L35
MRRLCFCTPFSFGIATMPKLKTHKATARRMQYSGAGKLMRTRQGKSHLRRNRSKRAQREYDEMFSVSKADVPRIKRLMPYAN